MPPPLLNKPKINIRVALLQGLLDIIQSCVCFMKPQDTGESSGKALAKNFLYHIMEDVNFGNEQGASQSPPACTYQPSD
jgi:hypothetical protein